MKVLVTGGSGVVGVAVLRALARHGHRTVALARNRPVEGADVTVRGDVRRPGLGLDASGLRTVGEGLDCIVHAAGVVDFTAAPGAVRDVNVTGTSRVLDLARETGARLVHVSTAYIDVVVPPDVTGGDATMRPGAYLTSKRAAEDLVRDGGVPYTIVRPSVVAGDAATGEISEYQGLHSLGRSLATGSIPLVLSPEDALYDFVPRDVVGEAIAAVVRDAAVGDTFWITAGEAALPARRVLDVVGEAARRHGLPGEPVRLVDAEMFERLIRPAFYDALDHGSKRKIANLLATLATLFQPRPLPTSLGGGPGVPPALTREAAERALAASVGYVLRAEGLAKREVA
ncbi:MAG TPA: SDR family oxidoreductase [Thermomonospora sp.]|nr:SDR family oxidoreductase [Thermomonospora sp.]